MEKQSEAVDSLDVFFFRKDRCFSLEITYVLGAYKLKKVPTASDSVSLGDIEGHALGDGSLRLFDPSSPIAISFESVSTVLLLKDDDRYFAVCVDSVFGANAAIQNIKCEKLVLKSLFDQFGAPLGCSDQVETLSRPKELQEEKFLFFKNQCGEMSLSVNMIIEVNSSNDVVKHSLVSSRAIGFIRRREHLVPVLTLVNSDESASTGSMVVLAKSDDGPFAFYISSIDQLAGTISGSLRRNFNIYDWIERDELVSIIKGYRNIFRASDESHEIRTDGDVSENAYLEFYLGEPLYVPLLSVQEVALPEIIPDASDFPFCLGRIQFRGQEISLIDGRQFYQLNADVLNDSQRRVLIFKSEDLFFGILVDKVTGILRIENASKIQLHRWLLTGYSENLRNDVEDFFNAEDRRFENALNLKVISFQSIAQFLRANVN